MFTPLLNLNSILEEVQIDQDQAETGFDDASLVIKFKNESFAGTGGGA